MKKVLNIDWESVAKQPNLIFVSYFKPFLSFISMMIVDNSCEKMFRFFTYYTQQKRPNP